MTDNRVGMLEVYRKVVSLKGFLELKDEEGIMFSRGQSEALIGKINECFAIVERRKGGRHDH